eukprot:8863374-Pyramimonas_sp.AAC.1
MHLSGPRRSDEYCASLGAALEGNTCVTELALNNCGITDTGVSALASALDRNHSLRVVKLQGTPT